MSDGSGTVVNVLITDEQKPTGRRSGNYKPSIWDFNFIQSLNNPHVSSFVLCLYNKIGNQTQPDDLYTAALKFRLFRQYGFHLPKRYLSVEGEDILESARKLSTTKLLERSLGNEKMDKYIGALVDHALALPTYWRITRVEARWFIGIYETKPDKNDALLELAKLDFNLLQATYQEDLKIMARWFKETRIIENLTFTRDNMVSCFFWTVGMLDEPQYSNIRRTLTKIIVFIDMIDDVYDVYGTLDELELFTDAILRWDVNAVENFPHYLKLCFLVTYNGINEALQLINREELKGIANFLSQNTPNRRHFASKKSDATGRFIQELRTKFNTAVNQDSPFCDMFIKTSMNFIRSAQCVYEFGDGHCNLDDITKDRISTLFFDPIPIRDLK
ncbi:hypothetical protein Leryth_014597 [Lithospermum erythrorhizon]|nr:hypothetical protein Leryth_014597 [Lithospermum erythrorhizon]